MQSSTQDPIIMMINISQCHQILSLPVLLKILSFLFGSKVIPIVEKLYVITRKNTKFWPLPAVRGLVKVSRITVQTSSYEVLGLINWFKVGYGPMALKN